MKIARKTLAAFSLCLLGCGSAESNEVAAESAANDALAPSSETERAAARLHDTLGAGMIERLEVMDGGWVVPRLAGKTKAKANVRLRNGASGLFRLEDAKTGAFIDVRPKVGSDVPAELGGGHVVYRRAGPDGGDVFYRVNEDGLEDFVVVGNPLESTSLDYEVSLGQGIAGLRKLGPVVEFLDAQGAPRLRIAPPYLVDALDKRFAAQMDVEGCAYDHDARPPWGRELTPPGASSCTVRVFWNNEGLTYPIVVDPAWSSTQDMAIGRAQHTATLLPSGKVLVIGGNPNATASEIHDPSTGTWAMTEKTKVVHIAHTATLIESTGRVLVVGGGDGTTNTNVVESWNPATGAFSLHAPLVQGRYGHAAMAYSSGNGSISVIVAGGFVTSIAPLASVEIWDSSTGTWSPGQNMPKKRGHFAAAKLLDGRIIATGGITNWALPIPPLWDGDQIGPVYTMTTNTVDIFDPATGTWSAAASMLKGRSRHAQIILPSGKIFAVGGGEPSGEVYDPIADTWTMAGTMATARYHSTLTLLPSNELLVVGGGTFTGSIVYASTEMHDPIVNTWSTGTNMARARTQHTATLLPSGAVLVVGGRTASGELQASAEIFAKQAKGGGCAITGECQFGLSCVDGVCCDKHCGGACETCSASAGAIADGTCTLLPQGHPGQPICSSGFVCNGQSNTCQQTCNDDSGCLAAYHCEASKCVPDAPLGLPCQTSLDCISGYCVDGVCCDGPCNGKCQTCRAQLKVSGPEGVCGEAKEGLDPRNECPDDGVLSCKRDGTCDGMGACKLYDAGSECKPATCIENTPVAHTCNGQGACLVSAAPHCGLALCSNAACNASCAADSDCIPEAYCVDGVCVPKLVPGAACTDAAECSTGFCTDGVCCNLACDGQCEACAEPGAEGICVPVAGSPRANREACTAADPEAPCSVRICDGIARDHCAAYVGASVPCAEPSCSDNVERLAAYCNGSGQCGAQIERSCAPFACDAATSACKSACTVDGDCSSGYACFLGQCLIGDVCETDSVLRQTDGTKRDCSPYRCEGGQCLAGCSEISDCAPGYACNVDRQCVKFVDDPGHFDCACNVAGENRHDPARATWTLVTMAAALLRSRRRASSRQNV